MPGIRRSGADRAPQAERAGPDPRLLSRYCVSEPAARQRAEPFPFPPPPPAPATPNSPAPSHQSSQSLQGRRERKEKKEEYEYKQRQEQQNKIFLPFPHDRRHDVKNERKLPLSVRTRPAQTAEQEEQQQEEQQFAVGRVVDVPRAPGPPPPGATALLEPFMRAALCRISLNEARGRPNSPRIFRPSRHPPTLAQGRVNRILFYPGAFNPPRRHHVDALRHALRNAGRDLHVVAAVVFPIDEPPPPPRGAQAVAPKPLRAHLWDVARRYQALKRRAWVATSCHEATVGFRARLVALARQHGFDVEFAALGGPDMALGRAAWDRANWGCRLTILTDAGEDEGQQQRGDDVDVDDDEEEEEEEDDDDDDEDDEEEDEDEEEKDEEANVEEALEYTNGVVRAGGVHPCNGRACSHGSVHADQHGTLPRLEGCGSWVERMVPVLEQSPAPRAGSPRHQQHQQGSLRRVYDCAAGPCSIRFVPWVDRPHV